MALVKRKHDKFQAALPKICRVQNGILLIIESYKRQNQ